MITLVSSLLGLGPTLMHRTVSAEHFSSLEKHIKEIGEYLQELESTKAQYFEAVLPQDHTVACH